MAVLKRIEEDRIVFGTWWFNPWWGVILSVHLASLAILPNFLGRLDREDRLAAIALIGSGYTLLIGGCLLRDDRLRIDRARGTYWFRRGFGPWAREGEGATDEFAALRIRAAAGPREDATVAELLFSDPGREPLPVTVPEVNPSAGQLRERLAPVAEALRIPLLGHGEAPHDVLRTGKAPGDAGKKPVVPPPDLPGPPGGEARPLRFWDTGDRSRSWSEQAGVSAAIFGPFAMIMVGAMLATDRSGLDPVFLLLPAGLLGLAIVLGVVALVLRRRGRFLVLDPAARSYRIVAWGRDEDWGSFDAIDHLHAEPRVRMVSVDKGRRRIPKTFWTVVLVWADPDRPPFPLIERPRTSLDTFRGPDRLRSWTLGDARDLGRRLQVPVRDGPAPPEQADRA